jgi:hypothetical protein
MHGQKNIKLWLTEFLYPGVRRPGYELATHLHSVRMRTSGTLTSTPCMPSRRAQGQIYLHGAKVAPHYVYSAAAQDNALVRRIKFVSGIQISATRAGRQRSVLLRFNFCSLLST